MDRIAERIMSSDLAGAEHFLQLYQRTSRLMAILTNHSIFFSFTLPLVYCFPVPLMDWMEGHYRSRQPFRIANPFDDKLPGVNTEELVDAFSPVVIIYYMTTIGIVVCGAFVQSMAQNLAFIVYSSPWYDMVKNNADMIRLVITISTRRIEVTAYRAPTFLLNRETFAKFIVTAISAFVTLCQMKMVYG
ncbi:unnamed protein product [Nezara viridula]|uniref:Uncharacterized protein n=1 Tax=Nezara viridula TaxID=85310 RepID=A0A9P0HN50_NEZVI|nr:unnamed protein product [Nezara viridula]